MDSIVRRDGRIVIHAASPMRRRIGSLRMAATGPGSPWDLLPRKRDLAEGGDWRETTALYRSLHDGGYTMVSARRARALNRAARTVAREGVPGALVDCGVWNGGSTILLARGAPGREVWAFDSFQGMPEPGEHEGETGTHYRGDCLGSEERLREGFRRYADPERLHVRPGWFEDTLARARDEVGPVAVLHVDADWYESVRLVLDVFYPLVSPGGFVLIDDYGHWPGAQSATDEFRAAVGDDAPLERADYTGRYWRKPA